MPRDVFNYVVAPILGVSGTSLLAISTPSDDENYYSVLFEARGDDGLPIAKVKSAGLACEKCKAAGKASECQCKYGEIPSWKSIWSQRLQKAILPKEVYEQESLGKHHDVKSIQIRTIRDRQIDRR